MNGVHDMGGMHGLGPVVAEQDEPVFHAAWEGRLFALRRAAGAWRKWNIDASRYAVERVPPVEHLQASYYARQYLAFIKLLVERGLVTADEIATGQPAKDQPKLVPPLTAAKAVELVAKGAPVNRDIDTAPRFREGQQVRAREIHPVTHTRLPRYVRGRAGTVIRDHGVFVFPDTNAQFLGEKPQHLYSVRFAARELWGEQAAAKDSVYLDLWDDYLDAV
jgi:nitrile hydratase subunit beta